MTSLNHPRPGDMVLLTEVPQGLLDNLPEEDRAAISQAVGRPVRLKDYDPSGRAELEFTDDDGGIHFIYVSPRFITAAK